MKKSAAKITVQGKQEGAFKTELAEITPWNTGKPIINGPRIFGAGVNSPFLFQVPATGQRPIQFSAEKLPGGLKIDSGTGLISGAVGRESETTAIIRASNILGSDQAELKIIIGDKIALTPPLGWNHWNCWGAHIDDKKIRSAAECLISSGLAAHGYSYINIDDGWQGVRGGPLNAIQPNENFLDMKGLCDYLHSIGIKVGIYSTPWVKSYAGYTGGSSGECIRYESRYSKDMEKGHYFGKYPHHKEDVRQWAEWGIDYLKYDWAPWVTNDVEVMHDALVNSGRDVVYSLSNSAPFDKAEMWPKLSNCWRTTYDISDSWESMSASGFSQDKWIPYSGPGCWSDPDMLVLGKIGWGAKTRDNRLTENEQITHVTLWALLAAPLLIGCDLSQLDDFTLRLLCNEGMLAVNQDPAGRMGHCVREVRRTDEKGNVTVHESVYMRELHNGNYALGLFNRADVPATIELTRQELGIKGDMKIRDIWANKYAGTFDKEYSAGIPAHGAQFILMYK